MNEFVKFFRKYSTHAEDQTETIPKFLPSIRNKQNNFRTTFTGGFKPVYAYSQPKMQSTFLQNCNLWLLKPHELNRGRGIHLFNKLSTLKNLLSNFQIGENIFRIKTEQSDSNKSPSIKLNVGKSNKFVIQKYVEKPYLINGRKFDIRIWALVDHEMNLYVFKEWYVRLSSETFNLNENQIDNQYVHLTNNAIQKHSTKYGKQEKGNIISCHEFKVYLEIYFFQF